MNMYDLIMKKRNGEELTKEEIQYIINGYTKGSIPDYQMSAFAMAVFFNDMSDKETAFLTDSMAHSGDLVDLSRFGSLSVDKHSTGGVGDKTTMVVAPIAASLGCKVAKMTGRGLGHTGGTADKLESIPGFRIEMENEEFFKQIEKINIAVVGQSAELAPADKKLYGLRDVTATVDSIPLIASSVMSKKLASGAKNIVLDVKCGSGAFMKTPQEAKLLAEKMVAIGKSCGRNMAALITNMDLPLGQNVGNSLEVIEAVRVLKGESEQCEDLRFVCESLASNMVSLALGVSSEEALTMVRESINSGKAYDKLLEWVDAQGGDTSCLKDLARFKSAKYSEMILSDHEGYITHMDTQAIGRAACALGAGREVKDAPIDHSAGIIILKKTGDKVKKGDELARFLTTDDSKLNYAENLYKNALDYGDIAPEQEKIIFKVIR